jgi:hypothetical protein
MTIAFELLGGFDVEWYMVACPEVLWLTCLGSASQQMYGTLRGDSSEQASFSFLLNASALPDFSTSAVDPSVEFRIASRAVPGPDFPFEGKEMVTRVTARVTAEPCLEPGDVVVSVGGKPLGEHVEIGSSVQVFVRVKDCGTRFPIRRYQPLWLGMRNCTHSGTSKALLQVQIVGDADLFEATLPAEWLKTAGMMVLFVSTDSSGSSNAVELMLSVRSQQFPVQLVVIGVITAGFLAFLIAITRFVCRKPKQAKRMLKAFVRYELLLAVRMFCSPCLPRVGRRSPWQTPSVYCACAAAITSCPPL